MSVNLPPHYRVISIVVIAFGVAFSTLAWSGDNRLHPSSMAGSDTIPFHPRTNRKPLKPAKKAEEGRTARDLDLRLDVDEFSVMPEMKELGSLNNIDIDLDGLRGLNARIEADVLKNVDAWDNLDALKELNIDDGDDIDPLDALNDMVIDDKDLQALKELNIDEDILNELRDLKMTIDDLRDQIEDERTKGVDEYRIRREVENIIEAVRAEMPRIRAEVERSVMREYKNGQVWQWQ